jgi:hypothetical protein
MSTNPNSLKNIVVRELREDDASAVQAVQGRNGLSTCSPETWKELWTKHPFREAFRDVPWGWALATKEREIVGTCTNVHIMYELEGQPIRAAGAASWAVDSPWRAAAFVFGAEFYRQQNVDLLLNASTSRLVSQLMPSYGMQRIPAPDCSTNLLWVCNYQKFIQAVLIKKRISAPRLLTHPFAGVVRLADDICSRRPTRTHGKIVRLDSFDERFDRFWSELRNGPPQLRAVRTAAALRWRFPSSHSPILTLERAGEMVGYLVLGRSSRAHLGNLQQYSVQDWQQLEQNPQDAQDLLVAAISATQQDGVDLLSLWGFDSWKRVQAIRLHPLRHSIGYWPSFYKSPCPEFQERLTNPRLWDLTPFEVF